MSRTSSAFVALLATFVLNAHAHTWIEEMQVISPNGTYIGDRGFSRGYVARTDANFDGDANSLWMLPSLDARMPDGTVRNFINSSDLLCHPRQRTPNYSAEYPQLKVYPGSSVAMKYMENGHVTLPWNQPGKPEAGGTAFVYGTTNPSPTEMIANVLKWNVAGTGGDGRGFLMTAQNFDDGRCHQINDCVDSAIRQVQYPNMIPDQPTSPGQEQWCETDLHIPSTVRPGELTIYWIWQWPTAPNTQCVVPDGKDEYYTTCADFTVLPAGSGTLNADSEILAENPTANVLVQENYQTLAVSTWKSRQALTISPSFTLENWRMPTMTAAAEIENAAFSSSCVAVLSSMQADPNPGLPPLCPSERWATGALFASVSASVVQAKAQGVQPNWFVDATGTPVVDAADRRGAATPAITATAPASTLVRHVGGVNAISELLPSTPAAPTTPPVVDAVVKTVLSTTVVYTSTLMETVTATPLATAIASSDASGSPVYSMNVVSTVGVEGHEAGHRRRGHARHFG